MNRMTIALLLALGAGVPFTATAGPADEVNRKIDECRAISALSHAADDRYTGDCLVEVQRIDDSAVVQTETGADAHGTCSRLVNQESLEEADRKLYLEACVSELKTAKVD